MDHLEYDEITANVILVFVRNKPLTVHKVFQLLFYFDFLFASQRGMNATNLTYLALKEGPTPKELKSIISTESIPSKFSSYIRLNNECICPLKQPDMDVFSERQIRILQEVKEKYISVPPTQHSLLNPWSITRRESPNKEIDIKLSKLLTDSPFDDAHYDYMKSERDEMDEIMEAFSCPPPFPKVEMIGEGESYEGESKTISYKLFNSLWWIVPLVVSVAYIIKLFLF